MEWEKQRFLEDDDMLTIFTPTYNRAHLIKNLYEDLKKQTSFDFEWVVVDDGSTDGTSELFEEIKRQDNEFDVRYVWKANEGKCKAFNKGVEMSEGALFLCVDSDDGLLPDAVCKIEKYAKEIRNNSNLIGLIFQKGNICDHSFESNWPLLEGKYIDIIDAKEVYNITETAIVIKSDILKRHPFPQFRKVDGNEFEKFLSEEILYNELIEEGKFVTHNDLFYVYEYKADGLTNNLFKLWIDNSNGTICALQSRFHAVRKYSIKKRVVCRLKCIMNLNALCIKTKKSIWANTPSVPYSLLCLVPSTLFAWIRFRAY